MAKRTGDTPTLPPTVKLDGIPEPMAADRPKGAEQAQFEGVILKMKPGDYEAYEATETMTVRGIVGRLSRAATRLVKAGKTEFKAVETFSRELPDGRTVAIVRYPAPDAAAPKNAKK